MEYSKHFGRKSDLRSHQKPSEELYFSWGGMLPEPPRFGVFIYATLVTTLCHNSLFHVTYLSSGLRTGLVVVKMLKTSLVQRGEPGAVADFLVCKTVKRCLPDFEVKRCLKNVARLYILNSF